MVNKKLKTGLVGAMAFAGSILPNTGFAQQVQNYLVNDNISAQYIMKNNAPFVTQINFDGKPIALDRDRNGSLETIFIGNQPYITGLRTGDLKLDETIGSISSYANSLKPQIEEQILYNQKNQSLNGLFSKTPNFDFTSNYDRDWAELELTQPNINYK